MTKATLNLVEQIFLTAALGDIQVKGFQIPIETFEKRGERKVSR